MSPERLDPGPQRGERVAAPPATRAKLRAAAPSLRQPAERSFWQLLPWRNFRRALFLLAALLAVLALRHAGGLSFSRLFDGVAPPPADGRAFQHLEVRAPESPPRHP